MNYRMIAQTILESLPPSELEPTRRFKESDDERIADVVWRRMQLEMSFNQPSYQRSSLLV